MARIATGYEGVEIVVSVEVSEGHAAAVETSEALATVTEIAFPVVQPDLVGVSTHVGDENIQVAIAIHIAQR